MAFDDYNYDAYNRHILIDENFDSPEAKLLAQHEGLSIDQSQPGVPLTVALLRSERLGQFEFDETNTKTE